jgi:hypothetical protein
MRGVWAKISQEEIISANSVQGKKYSILVFYTPVDQRSGMTPITITTADSSNVLKHTITVW